MKHHQPAFDYDTQPIEREDGKLITTSTKPAAPSLALISRFSLSSILWD